MRRLSPVLLILALTGTIAACGGDDEGGLASAGSSKSGKELTVYSGRNEELVKPLLERFSKAADVKLNVRYGDTAELAATIREEGDNSPADVFFAQDAGALGALQNAGALGDVPAATLDKVDARFRSKDGRWVGTSGRARIIAYDKRAVTAGEVPRSVFDLTAPQYKEKVGWAPTNGSFQAFVTGMRKTSGDAAAEAWLKGMKANGVKAYDNNILVRDAIANGEIELGLINHYYVLEAVAEEGADYPVGLGFTKAGDPGSLVNVAGVGVLKSSERQADAQALVDFLLADEAQAYFAQETKEYPLAGTTASPAGIPPLADLAQPDLDLSDLDDLAGTLELIERSGVL
jgi:iron(III) transport system substrate-binding protein